MNAPAEQTRLVDLELERVVAAARDAMTDDMVGRLSQAVGDSLALLDEVNRSGLGRAIPALAEMVNNGDLQRLVKLARLYGSAEDALTDEMVGRLSETLGNGLSQVVKMLEGLQDSGSLERIATALPQLADRLDTVQGLLRSIDAAATASRAAPPSAGGFGGLWQLMRDPESQDTLRFMLGVGKQLRKDWGASR